MLVELAQASRQVRWRSPGWWCCVPTPSGSTTGLTSGSGLIGPVASVAAGAATVLLVARRRPEPARWSAAVAVGAIVAVWALAQRPQILPGLTVEQAAAGDGTLVALLVSLAIGSAILIPSLVLLFSLVLRGRFDEPAHPSHPARRLPASAGRRWGSRRRSASRSERRCCSSPTAT